MACFNAAKISLDEYKAYKITPLELARSKVIDPQSCLNLNELFDLEYNKKNGTYIIKNKKMVNITFSELAIFLCDGLKNKYYTRDG